MKEKDLEYDFFDLAVPEEKPKEIDERVDEWIADEYEA